MPKFFTKAGLLTGYSLACGYVEVRRNRRMWQEHGVFHVREHHPEQGRIFWDSFATLGAARRRLFA
jgi:hypothetical protein